MSTVLKPETSPPTETEDPWRLGWRYVRYEGPDGLVGYERIPLRQEDLLHPQEDDFIVTNDAHGRDCKYLRNVFEAWAAGKESVLVLADARVDWQTGGVEPHGPDLAVFEGVRDWNPNDGTFTMVDHGARPLLVVEVTSPSTRENDLEEKVVEYHQAGVPFYAIVDRRMRRNGPEFHMLGYRANHIGYMRLPLDEKGRLWLEPIGLWLSAEEGRVVCYDAQGNRLDDYAVVVRDKQMEADARRLADARAAAEADARRVAETRAAAAEARTKELEAELTRLRNEKKEEAP
jgi:colicin import membrane protein